MSRPHFTFHINNLLTDASLVLCSAHKQSLNILLGGIVNGQHMADSVGNILVIVKINLDIVQAGA